MEILFLILKIVGVLLLACVLLLVAAVAVPFVSALREKKQFTPADIWDSGWIPQR